MHATNQLIEKVNNSIENFKNQKECKAASFFNDYEFRDLNLLKAVQLEGLKKWSAINSRWFLVSIKNRFW